MQKSFDEDDVPIHLPCLHPRQSGRLSQDRSLNLTTKVSFDHPSETALFNHNHASSTMAAKPPLQESRERLRELFTGPDADVPNRWVQLWDAGDFLPFDRGCPNPAFEDGLDKCKDLIGTATADAQGRKLGRRKQALVPGCGRGYDVLMLASRGYDAYGLDISETAVRKCREEQEKNGHKYMVRDEKVGVGKATFISGDFFNSGSWKGADGVQGPLEGFDLIYDYTVWHWRSLRQGNSKQHRLSHSSKFLSALPPSMRPAWSKQMRNLVNFTGSLICIEFPTYKEPGSGPPWALPPEVYVGHLEHPGEQIPYDQDGRIVIEQRPTSTGGFTRIAHWQPERTHEIGKGTDWVSVWQPNKQQ